MIEVKKKLDEMHVNLWRSHYPPLLLGKTYLAILIDANIQKLWVVYLQLKDEFVNVFQV